MAPTPRETLYVNVAFSLSRSFSACVLVVKGRERKINSPLRRSYTTHRPVVGFADMGKVIACETKSAEPEGPALGIGVSERPKKRLRWETTPLLLCELYRHLARLW